MLLLGYRMLTRQTAMIGLVFCFIVLCVAQTTAIAAPDTSNWVCNLCPFQKGTQATITSGVSTVSDDALRYGQGTGYDKQGVYALLGSEGGARTDKLRYSWLLTDLGLESRTAELRLSNPGTYNTIISYQESPSRSLDTTATVFAGASTDELSLPTPWTQASLTSGFSDLPGSLHPLNIESDRHVFRVNTNYQPSSRIRWFADYRRQEQQGVSLTSGAFFTNASLLPAPIDYSTDEIEVGLRLQNDSGFAELSFYGSYFDNANSALVWDNPFNSFPGAEVGSLALTPANNFQQISVRASQAIGLRTHLSGSAAIGQGEQNETFAGYTINPILGSSTLPTQDLDGQVDTTNLYFALRSKPTSKLDLNFSYRYDERDNQSKQKFWSRVILDSLPSGALESNPLFSSKRSRFHSRLGFKARPGLNISAGYDRAATDREDQEVAEQTENTGWGGVTWQPIDYVEFMLKAGTSKREIDRYSESIASSFRQNPLLRKFNLAHRYRKFGEMSVHASIPNKPISLSATVVYADDDYSQSTVGLLSADEMQVSLDATWAWSDDRLIYLNIGREDISSKQTGSGNFAEPNWHSDQEDSFNNYGLGMRLLQVLPNTDLTLDYSRAVGVGEIDVLSYPRPTTAFPDLKSNLDRLQLRSVHRLSDRAEIELQVRYERFVTKDWALQDVAPDTIASILTLGAQPYDYNILQFGLSFKYRFGKTDKTPNPT